MFRANGARLHLLTSGVLLERCAAELDSKGKNESWNLARTTANALFLRGFDQEILAEMKGIAEGASDAGAKWNGRRIDLIDMVVANTTVELGELAAAMPVTPTGLEGLHLESPVYFDRKRAAAEPVLEASPIMPIFVDELSAIMPDGAVSHLIFSARQLATDGRKERILQCRLTVPTDRLEAMGKALLAGRLELASAAGQDDEAAPLH